MKMDPISEMYAAAERDREVMRVLTECYDKMDALCTAAYERWKLMEKNNSPDKELFFRDFTHAYDRAVGAWEMLQAYRSTRLYEEVR